MVHVERLRMSKETSRFLHASLMATDNTAPALATAFDAYCDTAIRRLELRRSGALGVLVKQLRERVNRIDGEQGLPWIMMALGILAKLAHDPACVEEIGIHGGHQLVVDLGCGNNDLAWQCCSASKELKDRIVETCENLVAEFGATCAREGLSFPMRAHPLSAGDGAEEPFQVIFDNGCSVYLRQVETHQEDTGKGSKANYDVGYRLWGASVVLGNWIVKEGKVFHEKSILEIGSGLGLCGLVAGLRCFGAGRVHLSDFNSRIVNNLTYNIALNEGHVIEQIQAFQLDWDNLNPDQDDDDTGSKYDFVIGSDLICQESDCIGVATVLQTYLKRDSGFAHITLGSEHSRYGVDRFVPTLKSVFGNDLVLEERALEIPAKWLTAESEWETPIFVGSARSYRHFVIQLKSCCDTTEES